MPPIKFGARPGCLSCSALSSAAWSASRMMIAGRAESEISSLSRAADAFDASRDLQQAHQDLLALVGHDGRCALSSMRIRWTSPAR